MKHPKIPQGNAWNAIIPLFAIQPGGDKVPIEAELISDLEVKVLLGDKEVEGITFVTVEHRVIIALPDSLVVGSYSVTLTGKLVTSGLRYAKKYGFDIVQWQEQGDFCGLVSGTDVPLEDALFILSATDGEIEELEERLREAIAEAQAAKEEYIRKAGELTDVAHETNATQNKEEVIQAIGAIPQPVIPTDYAKEVTLTTLANNILEEIRTKIAELKTWVTNKTNDILSAIRAIPAPDLSSVAKEATLQGVSDKVGTFTDPTETVAHKLENLNIDTSTLATLQNQQKMMVNFNMADEMPELVAMTDTEILNTYDGYEDEGEHIEGIADNTYGHLVPAEVTIDDEPFTFYQERTYADYGYSVLYRNGVAIDTTTTHPQEDDELTTTNE